MTAFPQLLQTFANAVAANDGKGLAALFTADGVYVDGFYGAYAGRDAIGKMLQHFHETGSNFRWDFYDAVGDGKAGYARWRFGYASKMPGAEGKPVVFEGMSYFKFRDGLVERYEESFDRGIALVQQDFVADRIRRILAKQVEKQAQSPETREHLARLKTGS